jgi:hypothetical protein
VAAPSPTHPFTAQLLKKCVREEFGLRPTSLVIEHESKLMNPLYAYVNYTPRHLKLLEEES